MDDRVEITAAEASAPINHANFDEKRPSGMQGDQFPLWALPDSLSCDRCGASSTAGPIGVFEYAGNPDRLCCLPCALEMSAQIRNLKIVGSEATPHGLPGESSSLAGGAA